MSSRRPVSGSSSRADQAPIPGVGSPAMVPDMMTVPLGKLAGPAGPQDVDQIVR